MRSTSIPFPVIPLSGGTVSPRCRRTSDFGAISDASYDYATRRWLADPPTGEETLAASMARVAEAFATGRSAPLVIADHRTSEPIGLITCNSAMTMWRQLPTLPFPRIAAGASRRVRFA
jgi:hypothetical protein